MPGKNFSIRECAGFGFRRTFDNLGLFLIVALIFIGIVGGFSLLIASVLKFFAPHMSMDMLSHKAMMEGPTAMRGPAALLGKGILMMLSWTFILGFARLFFNVIVQRALDLGFMQIAFDVHDKGTSSAMRIFSRFDLLPRYLGALFMAWLIGFGFLLFCVATGIVFAFINPGFGVAVAGIGFVFGILFLSIRLFLFPFYIIDKNAGVMESLKLSFYATRGRFWKLLGTMLLGVLMMMTIIGIPAAEIMWVCVYRKIS